MMAKQYDRVTWSPFAIGGAGLVLGAALGSLLAWRSSDRNGDIGNETGEGKRPQPVGHVPTDLMQGRHPGPDDEAVDAFRPDMSAAVPEDEREAYRPVTIPVN